MSVTVVNNHFAYGTKSGTMYMADMNGKSAMQSLGTLPTDEESGDVAYWGTDNLMPQHIRKDIDDTGVLSAGIEAKARIGLGKGPMPAKIVGINKDGYEELQFVQDAAINAWMDENNIFELCFAVFKDLFGWGNSFLQLRTDAKRKKILQAVRMDVTECRLSKVNDRTLRSDYLYLCSDWTQLSGYDAKDKRTGRIALLHENFPKIDFTNRKSGNLFAMLLQYPLYGSKYYATAPWRAARKWVKIAQGVPEMKAAMFSNQMHIKYMVHIHKDYWEVYHPGFSSETAEKQIEIQRALYSMIDQHLVGGSNAYKSMFSTTMKDAEGKSVDGIRIEAIDDKIKDGKLLPDSGAANSEILFALSINPALMGADMPGGPYSGGAGSGSNIREAYLVQVMLQELERKIISKFLNLVRDINGWDSDIVWRFPNQILTTLNTGANTQPIA